MIGLYHARRGDSESAHQILHDLIDSPASYSIFMITRLALELGEVERCIDVLEREVEMHSLQQSWIRPKFNDSEALNEHPRYLALLESIGLDDESVEELHSRMSFD